VLGEGRSFHMEKEETILYVEFTPDELMRPRWQTGEGDQVEHPERILETPDISALAESV